MSVSPATPSERSTVWQNWWVVAIVAPSNDASSAVHVTSKPRAVQSSAKAQYSHSQVAAAIAKVNKPAKKPAPAVKTVVKSSNLPFTGLSLLPTVLVALALIAVGVLLRRREALPQKE